MSAEFVLRMGLEAGLALLTLLILLNFGTIDAVRQRGEVQRVSNEAPIFTELGVKYNLKAVQPRSKLRESRRGHVEDSGVAMEVFQAQQEAPVLQSTTGGRARRGLIGSAAPECGHTCGACMPCKMEVVSFECSQALQPHAEACPLGYLCICHGRSFPIP